MKGGNNDPQFNKLAEERSRLVKALNEVERRRTEIRHIGELEPHEAGKLRKMKEDIIVQIRRTKQAMSARQQYLHHHFFDGARQRFPEMQRADLLLLELFKATMPHLKEINKTNSEIVALTNHYLRLRFATGIAKDWTDEDDLIFKTVDTGMTQ